MSLFDSVKSRTVRLFGVVMLRLVVLGIGVCCGRRCWMRMSTGWRLLRSGAVCVCVSVCVSVSWSMLCVYVYVGRLVIIAEQCACMQMYMYMVYVYPHMSG